MSNKLEYPLWNDIQESRRKRAESGELTPIEWFKEKEGDIAAVFAGTKAQHVATIRGCSCQDFNINLKRKAPCKHMIRLAMELDFIPKGKMITDKDAALYTLGKQEFNVFIAEGNLLTAVRIACFLNELYLRGTCELDGTEDIENSFLRFFYTISDDGKAAYPVKKRKKDAVNAISAVATRLGMWLFNNGDALKAAMDYSE